MKMVIYRDMVSSDMISRMKPRLPNFICLKVKGVYEQSSLMLRQIWVYPSAVNWENSG